MLATARDDLCDGLRAAGLEPFVPQGTYFVNADVGTEAVAFCRSPPERAGRWRSRHRRSTTTRRSRRRFLLLMGVARADVPTSRAFEYSPYERETIAMVAKRHGLAVDPAPEGKIIESIETERLDVFERRDFLPKPLLFVNVFHATTRDHVIRREILQRAGERTTSSRWTRRRGTSGSCRSSRSCSWCRSAGPRPIACASSS